MLWLMLSLVHQFNRRGCKIPECPDCKSLEKKNQILRDEDSDEQVAHAPHVAGKPVPGGGACRAECLTAMLNLEEGESPVYDVEEAGPFQGRPTHHLHHVSSCKAYSRASHQLRGDKLKHRTRV